MRLDCILKIIMLWNIHFSNVRHAEQWYRWPGKTVPIGAQVAVWVSVHIAYNLQQQLQKVAGDTGTPLCRTCEVADSKYVYGKPLSPMHQEALGIHIIKLICSGSAHPKLVNKSQHNTMPQC